jgi:ribosomal-protein-alanine N-acetyltransferase
MIHQFSQSDDEYSALVQITKDWSFWSCDEVREVIAQEGSLLFYVKSSDSLLWHGLLLAQMAGSSTELLYLYVDADHRATGIAHRLFSYFLRHQKNHFVSDIFLEVRPSNQRARLFYERAGFKEISLRKKYYSDGEDALVLKLSLDLQQVNGE